ncbi:MAG: LysE family transporter [Thermodesulfobacteriota bacterium]|nr:LysE family transporter [Thermodesulfobacteriota bacterium]
MLTILGVFSSSFMIAFSGAMMPGPLLSVTISESASRGAIAGPMLILGHGILELLLIVSLVMGFAPFLSQDRVFMVIALAGGGMLFFMGVNMLRTLPGLHLQGGPVAETGGSLVLKGVLMSLANPYWLIWWATVGLGYILYCEPFGVWGLVLFFCGHILADLAWYSGISMTVARGKGLLNDRIYRRIIGLCALSLIAFAIYFIHTGLGQMI